MKRRSVGVGARAVPAPARCGMAEAYPHIHEFLCADTYDDGTGREQGSVLFCRQDGLYKAWVHDRDTKESAWVSAATLTALFVSLEASLAAGSLEWRRDGRKGRSSG